MLDIEQRNYAAAIAEGESADNLPGMSPEAERTGRTALVLGRVSLDEVRLDVEACTADTLDGVLHELGESLQARSFDALRNSGQTGRLNTLYNAEKTAHGHDPSPVVTLERIDTGIETGERAARLTLNTIRYRLENGQTITRHGLAASQRVMAALALLKKDDLQPTIDEISETVELKSTGEVVDVIKEEDCSMEPRTGLKFVAGHKLAVKDDADSYLQWYGEPDEIAKEAHLGCPVMLIKDFMRRYHMIAAFAAADRGLIKVEG